MASWILAVRIAGWIDLSGVLRADDFARASAAGSQ
jgi:hypothetical protein